MKTLHEVGTLGGWMNDVLISWGIPSEYANMFDEFVVAALIILLAVGLNYFFQAEDGIRDVERSRGLGMCIRDRSWASAPTP